MPPATVETKVGPSSPQDCPLLPCTLHSSYFPCIFVHNIARFPVIQAVHLSPFLLRQLSGGVLLDLSVPHIPQRGHFYHLIFLVQRGNTLNQGNTQRKMSLEPLSRNLGHVEFPSQKCLLYGRFKTYLHVGDPQVHITIPLCPAFVLGNSIFLQKFILCAPPPSPSPSNPLTPA
jgi:hypothetical protein